MTSDLTIDREFEAVGRSDLEDVFSRSGKNRVLALVEASRAVHLMTQDPMDRKGAVRVLLKRAVHLLDRADEIDKEARR